MIALFARANHPREGWAFGHGYVVVGVRCGWLGELARVKEQVVREGLRLPDDYRIRHIAAGQHIDWPQHEWYSGGGGAFDYLGTFEGDLIDGLPPETSWGSRGDNRFFYVYEASEVLREDNDLANTRAQTPHPETDARAKP